MRIAVFDYKVIPTNPTGGCNLRIVKGLCDDHELTVFSVEFDNPAPDKIRWVRIPVPMRPLAFLFVVYHALAPLYYWTYCLQNRVRFDAVLMVESNLTFGDVSYAHFCHRAYLRNHWQQSKIKGLRGWLRWLDYQLHALFEPWIYRRVKSIVVPSHGLARELQQEYPYTKDKILVLPNPVDIERMLPPANARESFRQNFNLDPEDLTLVFTALGQFERKGLPLLLEAMTQLKNPHLKLFIVGGEADLISLYQKRIKSMGLENQVTFTGMQKDVRPYLWAADCFILPSYYEVFPLVVLEAAAAGTLLIVTPLNGVEEFLKDGKNGILVQRTAADVARGISDVLAMTPTMRQSTQKQLQHDVKNYSTENFVATWSKFFEGSI
jgi:glycosyltransferase involved in cell wall biosynthesis